MGRGTLAIETIHCPCVIPYLAINVRERMIFLLHKRDVQKKVLSKKGNKNKSNQIKSGLFKHHISQKDDSGVFTRHIIWCLNKLD